MRLFLKVLPVFLAFVAVGALYVAWDQPATALSVVAPQPSSEDVINVTTDVNESPSRSTIASASTSTTPVNNSSIIWILSFIWMVTLTALLLQYRDEYGMPTRSSSP